MTWPFSQTMTAPGWCPAGGPPARQAPAVEARPTLAPAAAPQTPESIHDRFGRIRALPYGQRCALLKSMTPSDQEEYRLWRWRQTKKDRRSGAEEAQTNTPSGADKPASGAEEAQTERGFGGSSSSSLSPEAQKKDKTHTSGADTRTPVCATPGQLFAAPVPVAEVAAAAKAKAARLNPETLPGFLAVWQAYPASRRVSKPKAARIWERDRLEPLAEQIATGVERWKATEWQDREPRYIPHLTTWLNERRWETADALRGVSRPPATAATGRPRPIDLPDFSSMPDGMTEIEQ